MMWIGYTVSWLAIVALGLVVLVAIIALFPARWQFSRDLPSHLDTPSGPLRLTAMVGIGSRWRARWFFGLMMMKDGESPRARIVTPKRKP